MFENQFTSNFYDDELFQETKVDGTVAPMAVFKIHKSKIERNVSKTSVEAEKSLQLEG